MSVDDPATGTDDQLRAVREVVRRAQESQNETEALMALHTPDAVIINVAGRRTLGRDAFEAAMRQAMASPLAKVTTTTEVDDIRFASPGVAVVSCTKSIHDGRDPTEGSGAPKALPTQSRLTYVMVEDGEAWRIALAQTTPIR